MSQREDLCDVLTSLLPFISHMTSDDPGLTSVEPQHGTDQCPVDDAVNIATESRKCMNLIDGESLGRYFCVF